MVHILAHICEGQGGPLLGPELSFQNCVLTLHLENIPLLLPVFGDWLCSFGVVWGVNVDHLLTQKRGKCGPLIDPTAYVHIYIYRVKIGPRLGGFCVKAWSKSCVKNWSKFFYCFPPFYSVFGSCCTNSVNCAKIAFSQNCRDVKNEVFEKKLHFCFCLFMLLQEKQKKEKKQQDGKMQNKTYKNSVFKVVIQNEKNEKKLIFLAKIA